MDQLCFSPSGFFASMSPKEMAEFWKEIFVAGAAVITAFVAVRGINNWNRELRGKASFEVARNIAKATYKLRDEIRNCRSPFLLAQEFPDGYNSIGQITHEEVASAHAYVYDNRWKYVREALQEFDTYTLEGEAIWGNEIRAKTDELRVCTRLLLTAIKAFIANLKSGGEDFKADERFGIYMRQSVAEHGESNELTLKIDAAIKGIEGTLRPHLKR